ncbi:MAG: 8-oxo-dGTP diphosphatase [Actinomycetota bacterium]|nr:8-oxo-dGTP diphosphatase [Actinomycetota bacterium]
MSRQLPRPAPPPHGAITLPIVGSLAYIWNRDRDQVLMIHRVARPYDDHFGKYNGLGGKLERGESITENLRREVSEEANLTITDARLRGTIAWPGFGPAGEDWLGFVFVVEGFLGEVPADNPEGTLSWVDRRRLIDACSEDARTRELAGLPMWEGDRHFLPLVFDDDPRPFHGVMRYHDGRPTDWRFERLP